MDEPSEERAASGPVAARDNLFGGSVSSNLWLYAATAVVALVAAYFLLSGGETKKPTPTAPAKAQATASSAPVVATAAPAASAAVKNPAEAPAN